MLEKIAIFIIFLGPLVFFHELGHFVFARLFGVRVEVFSIGFGPKIFKFKKGFTEYAISIIPLGGYVKMFGDDPLSKNSIPEEDRKHSFTFKSKWARFWIVFGGPLANFILAYVIFFALFMSGEKIPEIKLGVIQENAELYQMGFRSGDILYKVNNKEIYNPSDIVLEGNNSLKTISIKRNGQTLQLPVSMSGEIFFQAVLKHPPLLRKPVVINEKGKAFVASLKGDKTEWKTSFAEMDLFENHTKLYLHPLLGELDVNIEPRVDSNKIETIKLVNESSQKLPILKALTTNGFRPIDLLVKKVNENSPAEKAGIKANDIILSLDNIDIFSFEDLRKALQNIEQKTVSIKILSDGVIKSISLTPEVKEMSGKKVKLIGVYSSGIYQELNLVNTGSKGIVNSTLLSFTRTWDTITKTIEGFFKLILGKVSIKSIGGPLAIGKVASDSFHMSLSYFFQLMALISVNLGVINLFPIPVLDGGHIMFIFFEIINRGPVSRRKMEIAQQVGLSFLLMLMVGAIFNDFSRFF
ncbi:MAG: RIP metalloprotease RseP [Bacteriovoracaceae bacterium]|jgi:regulator of sigma E protease|nr:RIP metalloprotease RseP [Bacteriovoracaceae bacterium]